MPIKLIQEGFGLPPVCTLYVRADGLGTPIGRPRRDSFGIKQPTDGYFKASHRHFKLSLLPPNQFSDKEAGEVKMEIVHFFFYKPV